MNPLERRRKEAPPLHLSEVTLPRHHGQQQQSSSRLTLNLDSAIDSLSNYSFSDSGALNQYVSWEIPPIPISSNNHQINSSFYELYDMISWKILLGELIFRLEYFGCRELGKKGEKEKEKEIGRRWG
ncbi:hypothetical protein V6N13_053820 [Hibiscus sabdariffa]